MRGLGGALRLAAALATVALPAAGCAPGAGPALPPGRPTVMVTMREYSFEHGTVPGGQVVFEVRNLGQIPHRLSLIPLPPELPPINEQLQGAERAVVNTQAAVPDVPPGGVGTFATELVPGRYALVCFNVDADSVSHALKGMATEFRIQ